MFADSRLLDYLPTVILPALAATLRMLFFSIILGGIIGLLLGTLLVRWSPRGLNPSNVAYKVLDFVISIVRAFPTIIFIVAITPLTRSLMGTSIGEKAALVPLTLTIAPIIARTVENSLLEVDHNVIVAARSFGASDRQIIWRVMFPEALPGLISGFTMVVILGLGSTTIAGAVGAGGLGSVALNYGYQRFDDAVMYTVVAMLFVIVVTIQLVGSRLNRKAAA